MDRIERARFLGICALQSWVDRSREGPVTGDIHLRALLALLALQGKGDPAPYVDFWNQVRTPHKKHPNEHGPENYVRGTYAQTHWHQIARDVGEPGPDNDWYVTIQRLSRT